MWLPLERSVLLGLLVGLGVPRRAAAANQVHLVWVPGHSRASGNDENGELACRGIVMDHVGLEPGVGSSLQSVSKKLSELVHQEHNICWSVKQDFRKSRAIIS